MVPFRQNTGNYLEITKKRNIENSFGKGSISLLRFPLWKLYITGEVVLGLA